MSDLEVVKKLRESIIFETAWLYETMPTTAKEKEIMIEAVKVIWNRAFPRAGFVGQFHEISFDEEDIRKVAELWLSKDSKLVVPKEINESDDEPVQ